MRSERSALQGFTLVFLQVLNAVVHHALGDHVLHEHQALSRENAMNQSGRIAHDATGQFPHGSWRQRVHDRQGNDHKQIGHLANGDHIGAVADDAEIWRTAPEAKARVELHADRACGTEQEDGGAHHHKGEHVVPALGLGLVDHPDDDPAGDQVGCEMQCDFSHGAVRLAGPRPRIVHP